MPPHFDAWRDIQIERVVFHSSRSWEEAAGAVGVSISGLFPGWATAPSDSIRAWLGSPALTAGMEGGTTPKSRRKWADPGQEAAGEGCPGFLGERKAE